MIDDPFVSQQVYVSSHLHAKDCFLECWDHSVAAHHKAVELLVLIAERRALWLVAGLERTPVVTNGVA